MLQRLQHLLLVALMLGLPLTAQTAAQAEPQTRQEILQRQREEKRGQLEPYVVSRAEERVQFLETWRLPFRLFSKGVGGFRPVVGGLPSGSGFVGGGGYITGYNSDLLQFTASARYSTRGYQAYDAGLLIFPRTNSILPVEGYVTGGVRDLTSLRFFGLGSDSSRGDRTTYRLQDRSVETGMTAWAGEVAEFGARVQWLRTETGPGQAGTSLDDRFDPDTIPGFGTENEFFVYGGRAMVHLRESNVIPSVGVTVAVEASRYDDRDRDDFDFTRVVGDVQAHIPLGHRNRILALHARTSHSVGENGGAVPFELMETLGGADINHQAADGTSPLLIATINGHFDLGLELLERGADPNLPAHSGIAPLYAALNLQLSPVSMYPQPTNHMEQEVEYRDYMRALLEAGAEPNARLKMRPWFEEHLESKLVDPSGATPFWRAAYALDVKTMRMLVDYGADPTIPSVRTPSRSRLDRERPDRGEEIDHSGMPPVPVGGPSNTPLHVAAGAGHANHGSGPVHRHVPGGWMPAVRYLVEEIGLDVNARDHEGLTPLHGAAGRGDTTMIRYLVEHGADPTLKSRHGLSTADFANSLILSVPPYPEAIELLRSLGSDFRDECAYC